MRGTERNQILKTNQKQRSLGPSVIHSRLSNQERELSIFRGFIFFVLCCVFFPNVCLCLSVKIQTWFQLACGLLWGPGLPELNSFPHAQMTQHNKHHLRKACAGCQNEVQWRKNHGFCALATNNSGDNTHTLSKEHCGRAEGVGVRLLSWEDLRSKTQRS